MLFFGSFAKDIIRGCACFIQVCGRKKGKLKYRSSGLRNLRMCYKNCKNVFVLQFQSLKNQQKYMQNSSFSTSAESHSPEIGKRRLSDLKQRLSLHIQKILDDTKKEAESYDKDSAKKTKVYRDLNQVQCMKDVKSQTGFYHQYEVLNKLGQGCHSSVYKCILKNQKKSFAVKMTKQKDLQLFQSIREGYRILKKLQHENVIQPKNLFINEKFMTCFMVIQYCEWQDLRKYLKSKVEIDREQASQLLTELLKTVAYLHNCGVCHRDLKPDNILYDPNRRKLKVIDFDLARMKKFTHSQLELMTKTGCLTYRAPQIFKAIYDEKVDIWSVGVIAYELLTRKIPFLCEFEQDQIRKICNDQPSYTDLSVWQIDLLQKLLCKDPKKRVGATEALSSPFFLNVTASKTMIKSPSVGKEEFERSLKNAHTMDSPNKFYDDDVTDMFLGNCEGDIGVIRCDQSDQSSD